MSYRRSMQQMPSTHISMTRSTPQFGAASIYAGAGGHGARISSVSSSSLRSGAPMASSSSSFKVSSGMGGGMGAGFGGGGASMAAGAGAGILGNEKGAMQNLNDRLANYLDTVRNLEKANSELEMKIRDALEKGGPELRDYSKYEPIIDDLRKKIFDKIAENARFVLQIDNARLAADDFKVKFDNEIAIRQSVEADIAGLKKVIDDTNMSRMNIESEIEAVKEELVFLKKNHENEVMELRNQISQSGVQVDVDAPKGQDLAQIMEDVRSNYEKMAVKNAEDLKRWHENQISDVQVQVSQNTEALQGAHMEKSDLSRQIQTLEIELASQQSLKASLEDTLRNTELRNNMETEKYNGLIIRFEEELSNLRANIQQQTQDYEALLNMKMKLEAEIGTYKTLLDGGDFKLQDALDELAATS
ncbi:keratin, type I cytoskeletal 18-like [Seriola lalandi dorsalis]|uniref:Keratin 18b n=1 Tax=Seriola lalandi dorsalis TaxID=1841481 RepID=A0A3B4XLT0_SERLL|nr:keratin, type I cytoskeletal 18-like [Seriola lalandi dorsalis]XP_056260478.1 keratin, type I cytoskeletal 18-like [Seriola aureovittata]